jgi:hypothetical protein
MRVRCDGQCAHLDADAPLALDVLVRQDGVDGEAQRADGREDDLLVDALEHLPSVGGWERGHTTVTGAMEREEGLRHSEARAMIISRWV